MTATSDPHRDLAGVLHDVSNALTVLLGWIGEARSPDATPDSVAYALGIIEQRAGVARDLARQAIGGPRLEDQRALGVVVDETCTALAIEAQRAGARLVIGSSTASAQIEGALDFAQIMTNLVLNALAYAPRGSEVGVHADVDSAQCSIVVADAGPGIAFDRHEGIFQGDSLRPGGTGVGLRHSRALARAHRGEIELLKHDGKGARFRLTWPRVDAVPRPPVSAPRAVDLAGMRVLVLEDDLAVCQLLETVLEARGADVTVASSASQLMSALTDGPFDAALVDLSPIASDTSGALDALRASSPTATVVLVTGNADASHEALGGPNVELVRKPFEVREVVALLSRLGPNRTQSITPT